MTSVTRRNFLKYGSAALGSVYAMNKLPFSFSQEEATPHFFLQIYIPGGLDPTYTFDARPLEMCRDQIQHNILEEEPFVFEGVNGGRCLRTNVSRILESYLGDFSIINGIHMSQFDGHEQNISYLMTANPFGGDAFLPFLNRKDSTPLDFVRMGDGNFLVQLANDGNAVHLSAEASKFLSGRIHAQGGLRTDQQPLKHLLQRTELLAEGSGGFAVSAAAMANGLRGVPIAGSAFSQFYTKVQDFDIQDGDADVMLAANLLATLYSKNLTRAGIFVFNSDLNPDLDLDVHGAEDAKLLPKNISTIYNKIIRLLDTFKNIPYDSNHSIYDLTTVLICSEFGRTMRSMFLGDRRVNERGTDHNPFVNTALIGGKGIRGGLVIGDSDIRSSDEFKNRKVSRAHLSLDPKLEKIMGKTFDFATCQSTERLPEQYSVYDYLGFPSITNTILSCFDVPQEKYFTFDRNGKAAPVLKALLV